MWMTGMTQRLSQWMLCTAIASVSSMLAMVFWEQAALDIAESLLRPWFAVCQSVTPLAWQVRGNILLSLGWLISGVIIYSALISAVGLGLLELLRQRRSTQRPRQANAVTATRSRSRFAFGPLLLLCTVFCTLFVFVAFDTDSVSPQKKLRPSNTDHQQVERQNQQDPPPLKVTPDNRLPNVVYAGGVQDEYHKLFHRHMRLSDDDVRQITRILKQQKIKFTSLEITRTNEMTQHQFLVHPEPEANVIHTGLGLPFDRTSGQWRYMPSYWNEKLNFEEIKDQDADKDTCHGVTAASHDTPDGSEIPGQFSRSKR